MLNFVKQNKQSHFTEMFVCTIFGWWSVRPKKGKKSFFKHPKVPNLDAFSTIFLKKRWKKHPIWQKLSAFLTLGKFHFIFWDELVHGACGSMVGRWGHTTFFFLGLILTLPQQKKGKKCKILCCYCLIDFPCWKMYVKQHSCKNKSKKTWFAFCSSIYFTMYLHLHNFSIT